MLFIQLMRDGGPVMWVILLCSFIALFIFLEKWLQFHREQINANELLKGLTNVLKRDGYVEAITLCDNTPGPIARVLVAIILSCQRGDKDLRQAVEDANLEEIPKLERHMNILGTIGYIAPLLGLLGTVVGMMHAFQEIGETQGIYLNAAKLSTAINMALITTAAGLAVAIPCYVAYNYLVNRIESVILDMDKAAAAMLTFLSNHRAGTEVPEMIATASEDESHSGDRK